ncbi:MAG: hypothetical protein U5N58_08755 [Actinomycetota bacterium]|nr:hypothetical protein [Actinomycetota bacterium]
MHVVVGNLNQLMMLVKGLPSSYNRDLQEDKGILFSAVNNTKSSINIFAKLVKNMEFKPAEGKLEGSFMQATDIADYLVKKGESFRNSHNIVGRLVAYCIDRQKDFSQLKLDELKKFSPYFDQDYYDCITIESCIDSKTVSCGTATASVEQNIEKAKKSIETWEALSLKLKNKVLNYAKFKQEFYNQD